MKTLEKDRWLAPPFSFDLTLLARSIALALMLCAGLLANAFAQTPKRLALVIGNDSYKSVQPLRNARNDARLIAGVLRKAGFTVTTESDVDRTRFYTALDNFRVQIGRGDEVVFYYAGHGVQVGANQMLLPVDIAADSDRAVERNAVTVIDVQDAIRDARVALLILDACRDNPFPKQGTRSIGGTRGLIPPDPVAGQLVVMSAGRNQKALDRVPGEKVANGLFTYELAQAIQTPGVDVRTAMEQVKDRVEDRARQANHEQRPSLTNDIRGSFYLFGQATVRAGPTGSASTVSAAADSTPAAAAPVQSIRVQSSEEVEQQLWDAIKDSQDPKDFETYIDAYPQGRFVVLAKQKRKNLTVPSQTARRSFQDRPKEALISITGDPDCEGIGNYKSLSLKEFQTRLRSSIERPIAALLESKFAVVSARNYREGDNAIRFEIDVRECKLHSEGIFVHDRTVTARLTLSVAAPNGKKFQRAFVLTGKSQNSDTLSGNRQLMEDGIYRFIVTDVSKALLQELQGFMQDTDVIKISDQFNLESNAAVVVEKN